MKKKLVLGLLTLGTASLLCGFDSAQTADSILQKMQENSTAQNEMSAGIGMNCDVAIDIGDGTTTSTVNALLNADFDMDTVVNPLAMRMAGTVNVSFFGQSEEISMQLYSVTNENGELESYVYEENSTTGEGSWSYDSSEALDMAALMEQSANLDPAKLSEWGLSYALAPEAADFNGTECYLLTSTIDSSTLSTMLAKASELTGEDLTGDADISAALEMLSGIRIDLSYYVDTASFLPVAAHIDLNNSDFSSLNALAAQMLGAYSDSETETTVAITVNDISMDLTMSYDPVDPITVPDEAIAAVQESSDGTDDVSAEEIVIS